jgi:hypothetical protein
MEISYVNQKEFTCSALAPLLEHVRHDLFAVGFAATASALGASASAELTCFYRKTVEVFLVGCCSKNLLLDRRICDQSEHAHFVSLSYTVSSVLGLRIHHRVPGMS